MSVCCVTSYMILRYSCKRTDVFYGIVNIVPENWSEVRRKIQHITTLEFLRGFLRSRKEGGDLRSVVSLFLKARENHIRFSWIFYNDTPFFVFVQSIFSNMGSFLFCWSRLGTISRSLIFQFLFKKKWIPQMYAGSLFFVFTSCTVRNYSHDNASVYNNILLKFESKLKMVTHTYFILDDNRAFIWIK